MTPRVSIHTRDGIAIVAFTGPLLLGHGADLLRSSLRRFSRQRALLDLRGVTRLDSSALGELVGAYAQSEAVGGELKLLQPGRRVQDLLVLTKLCTVFEVYEDERAAVESFLAPWPPQGPSHGRAWFAAAA